MRTKLAHPDKLGKDKKYHLKTKDMPRKITFTEVPSSKGWEVF